MFPVDFNNRCLFTPAENTGGVLCIAECGVALKDLRVITPLKPSRVLTNTVAAAESERYE